jgi:two-component system, sensor histidine kinase and response regulator
MSNDRTNRITDDSPPRPSASGSASSADPIDREALAELRSHFDGQESVSFEDLLALFLDQMEPRLSAIRSAIERADATGMKTAAHVLRGSSMLVGARAMAAVCLQIELAGRSGAMAEAQVLMTLLEDEAIRVRRALTDALKRGAIQ